MGERWGDESSVNRQVFAWGLGSVVQSLRFNSSRMLPVVRSGFKCIFEFCQDRSAFPEGVLADEGIQAEPDEDDQEDVMNQLVDFTHVHTHVHTHVYTHVHAHVHTHVHTHVCTHVCTHLCTHVQTYVCIHVCTHVYAQVLHRFHCHY